MIYKFGVSTACCLAKIRHYVMISVEGIFKTKSYVANRGSRASDLWFEK